MIDRWIKNEKMQQIIIKKCKKIYIFYYSQIS